MNTKKPIALSDHFTLKRILRFALPSILMMVFISIYSIVDGFFISNFCGKAQFTAVNIVFPFANILCSLGFMFGAGGSALIGKLFGEKKIKEGNQAFSLLVYACIIIGLIVTTITSVFLSDIVTLLRAEGQIHEYAMAYGRIIFWAIPFALLQFFFQAMFVTAEKPHIGLFFTLGSGCLNMFLDFLFVGVFSWGLEGAATATLIAQILGGVGPLVFFLLPNGSLLRIGRPSKSLAPLLKATTNGSSELLANVAMSLVAICYNAQLLSLVGEDGVAAYGVLMYVGFVFCSAFIGYSVGTAPIVAFHHGAKNSGELRSLLKKSLTIIALFSVLMFGLSEAMAWPLAMLFVSYDQALTELVIHAFRFASFQFLFVGLAIYGSGYFTALNNGLISAIISFLRTLVFQIGAVFLFPLIWGPDGIWFSLIGADALCAILVISFLLVNEKKYHYGFWKNYPLLC